MTYEECVKQHYRMLADYEAAKLRSAQCDAAMQAIYAALEIRAAATCGLIYTALNPSL